LNYKELYESYLLKFNNQLELALNSLESAPNILKSAMRYAVAGGGKRIRPVLLIATANMLGVDFDKVKEFAVAIECIHSYSLVHDDLPAMDNDDYRRGKPSTHKKFGEAYGILAGDALLNFAFEYCLSKEDFGIEDAKALKYLGECAGCFGMIAGQVLDLQNEKNPLCNQQILYEIYLNKTAKLIMAPVIIASIIAGEKHFNKLKDFAYNLGVMFQIADDILDVEGSLESIGKTPKKDKESDKLTSIKIFGLDGAKLKKKEHYDSCIKALEGIDNNEFLLEFAKIIYERKN
jgi:geranylgeranyl diphosphate synthase type II